MRAPSFAATEEVLRAYIIYIVLGSIAIEHVVAKHVHRNSFGNATNVVLGVALHSCSLACIAQIVEDVGPLAGNGTSVEGCSGICKSGAPIALVLHLAADVVGVLESLYLNTVKEDSVDLILEFLCVVPELGGVVLVFVVELFCFGNDVIHCFPHLVGQQSVGLGVCKCVVELLEAIVIVHLGNVDAAVIELAAPVLLDVCGDDVLADVEVLGGDVNLHGVLAHGPVGVLLQQVAVHVCFVNVIMANVQLVGDTRIDALELEVTANPVVGVVAAGPDALHFWHEAFVADRHHLVIPHRVVEVGLSPAQCLGAAFNLGSVNLCDVLYLVSFAVRYLLCGCFSFD